MLERMNNEIKSCVLHNLLKTDFAPHTFTMVLWDSWTSANQDKMIKQHEEEALKVVLYELLNASFSLFDTKNEWTKISLGEFFLKSSYFINKGPWNYMLLKTENIVLEITSVHKHWLNNKILLLIG